MGNLSTTVLASPDMCAWMCMDETGVHQQSQEATEQDDQVGTSWLIVQRHSTSTCCSEKHRLTQVEECHRPIPVCHIRTLPQQHLQLLSTTVHVTDYDGSTSLVHGF